MCGNRNHFKPTTYNNPHITTKAKVKAKEKEKEKAKAKAKAKAKEKAKNGTYMPIKYQIMTTIRISESMMELTGAEQKATLN